MLAITGFLVAGFYVALCGWLVYAALTSPRDEQHSE